jgi:hypothetical protein
MVDGVNGYGRHGKGGLTCMVLCGTVDVVQGCCACLARRLAIGEPLGACGSGGVSCGGVVSLGGGRFSIPMTPLASVFVRGAAAAISP